MGMQLSGYAAILLGFIAMCWMTAFVAALLLSGGQLFHKLPRRRRLRLPTAAELNEWRNRPRSENRPPPISIWFRLLSVVFAPFMLAPLFLVLIPAFVAMYFCCVCQNYRYVRCATHRVLRQRNSCFAAWLSYPLDLPYLFGKLRLPNSPNAIPPPHAGDFHSHWAAAAGGVVLVCPMAGRQPRRDRRGLARFALRRFRFRTGRSGITNSCT